MITLQLAHPAESAHAAFFGALRLFPLGASWGGVHSVAAFYPAETFASRRWNRPTGPLVRLSVGLEDPGLLMQDLVRGLAAFVEAAESKE